MRALLRRPEALAGLVALVLGGLHLLLAPGSGTDLSAQLARASFARTAPLTPVDLSWYSGTQVLSYSLLAPLVMAALTVTLAGLLAAVAGAVLLARLLGPSRWAAVAAAVVCVVDVVDGRTTFALGAVAGLGALVVLPRRLVAGSLAVLTALLSPVAAVFLGLAALVLVLHRRPGGWVLGLSAALPVVLLAALFPGSGVQPFTTHSWIVAALAGVVVAALTTEPLVRSGSLLYAAAVLLLVPFDDAFGSNVLRLALLLTVPVLIASGRGRRSLALAVLAFTLWQAAPPFGDLTAGGGPPTGALKQELVALDARRVEVVPARDHREASSLVDAVPLARGWSRQLDLSQNALFYRGTLTATDYLDWLSRNAVDLVALPRHGPLDMGGRRENALLTGPSVQGLEQVWNDSDWTVWRVVDPRPIAAAPATVVSSGRTELVLSSQVAATVDVSVRWSRWLSVSGPGCVSRQGDLTRIRFDGPGTVLLGSSLAPSGHC